MKKIRPVLSAIIMVLFCAACNGDCKTFSNDVPTELPPNLKNQLNGLLNNNKWVLANSIGDTQVFEAKTAYTDEIRITQCGKSTDCIEDYEGERLFSELTSDFSQFIRINTSTNNLLYVNCFDFSASWCLDGDFWCSVENDNIILKDSLVLDNKVYYNVFHKSDDIYYAFNTEIGLIGLIDTTDFNRTFKLVSYE